MKHVVDTSLQRDSAITKSIEIFKKIVATFKHANLNSKLLSGSALQQEVATRFGTTCDTIERFLSSYADMFNVVKNCETEARVKITNLIEQLVKLNIDTFNIIHLDGSDLLSALSAFVEVFKPIRHNQTLLEGNNCTIIQVLPLLERIKYTLRIQSTRYPSGAAEKQVSSIAGLTLNEMNKLIYYNLWCASCILFPDVSNF